MRRRLLSSVCPRALRTYPRPPGINVSVFCPDIPLSKFHSNGRWIGMSKGQLDASLPLDIQRPVDAAVAHMLECLEKRKYLVSFAPGCREILTEDAETECEQGAVDVTEMVAGKTSI